MKILTLAAIAASALLFAGCTKSVSKSDVEKQVASQYSARGYGNVDCKGDLEGKVGKSQTCSVSDGKGHKFNVLVTVVTVKGNTANFSVRKQ
jgi:hypothetical protein